MPRWSTTSSPAVRATRLHLRHLIDGGDLTTGATLPALIDGYLSGLPSPVRTVLDYLALAEPLRRSDVTALAGADAVEQAEAVGAVAVDGDAMVYPAHPLYTARAARGAGAGRRARRCARRWSNSWRPARPATSATGCGSRRCAVDSDDPGAVADLVSAAQHALRLGELDAGRAARHAPRWTAQAGWPRGWRWPTRWPGRAADEKPTRC